MILDIHSHRCSPEAVVSVTPDKFVPQEGQLYSVGLHPWWLPADLGAAMQTLEALAMRPDVVAIGECGLDLLKLAQSPMYAQIQAFRSQVELSEKLRKPIVIHDVRAHQEILQTWRDMRPSMPWALHGFNAKPTVLEMFRDTNVWFSFGARFNAETLRLAPIDRILAETDESEDSIEEVIAALEVSRGEPLLEVIAANTARFLSL